MCQICLKNVIMKTKAAIVPDWLGFFIVTRLVLGDAVSQGLLALRGQLGHKVNPALPAPQGHQADPAFQGDLAQQERKAQPGHKVQLGHKEYKVKPGRKAYKVKPGCKAYKVKSAHKAIQGHRGFREYKAHKALPAQLKLNSHL